MLAVGLLWTDPSTGGSMPAVGEGCREEHDLRMAFLKFLERLRAGLEVSKQPFPHLDHVSKSQCFIVQFATGFCNFQPLSSALCPASVNCKPEVSLLLTSDVVAIAGRNSCHIERGWSWAFSSRG